MPALASTHFACLPLQSVPVTALRCLQNTYVSLFVSACLSSISEAQYRLQGSQCLVCKICRTQYPRYPRQTPSSISSLLHGRRAAEHIKAKDEASRHRRAAATPAIAATAAIAGLLPPDRPPRRGSPLGRDWRVSWCVGVGWQRGGGA